MPESEYPRVLIINGEPISAATATGLTMDNLFAGWPAEDLAQIVTSSLVHERRFAWEYLLQPMERRGLNWLRSRAQNVLSDAGHSLSRPEPVVAPRNGRSRSGVRAGLRKWLDLVPYELPAQVEKSIVQFRPDVIYTCLGNIQISRMALHCAALCGIRIVPHFMDDWISTMYAGRPDLLVQRHRLLSIVRRVIGGAPLGMAISELMAAEYSSTYCVPFHSFMNCVTVPAAAEPESAVDAAIGPRLVYVGGLHLGRWRSLNQIGEALASLSVDGVAGRLSIYAPAEDIAEFRDKLAGSSIEIAGSLAQHEVTGVLRGGQVMVHVESFEQKIRSYTRLSMSTKIPQYMAAARPILCYGPGEVASCQFIGENACGLVVDSQNKPKLAAALRRLLEDPSLRKQLGGNGWRVARKKFNAEDVRQRFRALIAEVAGQQGFSQTPLAHGR